MLSTTYRATILLVAVAAIAVAAGCSQQAGSQTPGTAPPPSGASTSSQPSQGSSPVKVGVETKSGDWTLTVDKVFRAGAAGGVIPAANQDVVVVDMTLTHKGKAEGIGPTAFKLKAASGATYQAAPTSDSDYIFNIEQPFKADTATNVKIAFLVPKGTTGLTLTFAPFIEGGPTQPVDVTLD